MPRWAGLGVRVRLDHHEGGVAVASVGDEKLAPVDHVLVALADGDGLDGGDVAAGVGLRHGQRAPHFAAGQAGKPPALLLSRAETGQRVGQN